MNRLYKYGASIYNIDEIDYITTKEFARITTRSMASIRQLISKGNSIRKIRVIKIDDKPFIPLSELYVFPFTIAGRGKDSSIGHYYVNEEGWLAMRSATPKELELDRAKL